MTEAKFPTVEDQSNEFKSKANDLEREIVAFANAKGGTIFIGIDDKGQQTRIVIDNRLRSQIIDAIENCEPRPEFLMREEQGIIVLEIKEGVNKPYRAPEGFFLRIGASSRKLKRDEILKFSIDSNRILFDSQLRPESFSINESNLFSPSLFGIFRENSRFEQALDDLSLIKNLNLIVSKDNLLRATNALALLFSRDANKFFPQARVIIWELADETKVMDQRIVVGDLFAQLTQSITIIQDKLRKKYSINGLKRDQLFEINDLILRELIVNALIHRDYFELGAEVQVKIYPSKLEISNPGKPLYGLNPKDLIGKSLRRNPLLAEIFHRAGYLERAGTGLLRVQRYLKDEGFPPLILQTEGEFFIATVVRKESILSEAVQDKELNDRQKKILNLLLKKKNISALEYAKLYKISDRLARLELSQLVEQGKITRVRDGRSIRYHK